MLLWYRAARSFTGRMAVASSVSSTQSICLLASTRCFTSTLGPTCKHKPKKGFSGLTWNSKWYPDCPSKHAAPTSCTGAIATRTPQPPLEHVKGPNQLPELPPGQTSMCSSILTNTPSFSHKCKPLLTNIDKHTQIHTKKTMLPVEAYRKKPHKTK